MKTTVDLLNALRARAGSDRKAAALIGVSQQTVNRWRMGYARPDDESAARIANALSLDHAFVLAVIYADRAETDSTRATWARIAEAFGKAAMLALVAAAPFAVSPDARASHNQNLALNGPNHTLRNRRAPRTLLGRAARTLGLLR